MSSDVEAGRSIGNIAAAARITNTAQDIATAVSRRLLTRGLDLVQSFDAARYNEQIAEHASLAPLPLFGRARAMGLLIGNTRALWPHVIDAFRARPELREVSDPLDSYVVGAVQSCTNQISHRTLIRFAHDVGEGLVSMLHLAEASGMARIGPAHLAVHTEHGPWFGLRAVIVVDADPPARPSKDAPEPCHGCDAPCRQALDRAVAAEARSDISSPLNASSWRDWVAVRDACPIGRASRYGEEQIRYHYTKDRAVLRAAVARIEAKA